MILRRSVTVGVAVTAVLVLTAGGCGSDDPDGAHTRVSALWWGTQADGSTRSGVTPVTITARYDPTDSGFAVDLQGLRKAGAGEAWNAAAWSAAAIGTLGAGVDPRGRTISYSVGEAIDGPSAGALLTAGVLADLLATPLAPDISMTGTVLPSGGIGQVSGVPEKVRAAADAGITTVLVPQGQAIAVDAATKRRVDTIALGVELGVDVVEIPSVRSAFAQMAPTLTPAPQAPVPAMDADVLGLFETAAQETLARVAALTLTPSPSPALAAQRAEIEAGVQSAIIRVPELLGQGRQVEAYARAALAERTAASWNARAVALSAGAPQASLVARATELVAAADVAVAAAASTPVTFTEQMSALPDALSWGVDAGVLAQVVAARLAHSSAAPDFGQAAADLAQAQYDLDHFLPISVRTVALVGQLSLVGPGDLVELLAAYAELVADAGAANLSYFDQVVAPTTNTAPSEAQTAVVLRDRWAELAADSGADQGAVVTRMATALSFYVAGATAVAIASAPAAAAPAATPSDATPDGATANPWRIADQRAFTTQVDVATEETAAVSGQLAHLGADTSYLQWNEVFGRSTATAPTATGATDDIRLGGLQVQWYGNVDGKLLTALTSVP